MNHRHATVLVSDDASYTLAGKLTLSGVYTSDIQIPMTPYFANQLIFTFLIDAPHDDPCKSLELYVSLPNNAGERRLPLAIDRFVPSASDAVKWTVKYPLLFPTPMLTPGPIDARVFHEKGEIVATAPFIVLIQPTVVPTAAAQETT
jgi:hypothetical protein